ncbi:hypothetical protein DPM19_03860 [Actinomadura craniellae]|uniref:Uncharacterized protein n=1 Tax=Actinomadura craniellae TaxID=2231787 RepID=A0A365HAM4_9ACTN|nr:hypothetical protein [Actinomadura craniellae]RAY16079.1 hypothetical protein DPM19_03860 [Actinomadura craniellae]
MFEIWETGEPTRFITGADTLEVALDKVDTMCRLRHDQESADIERSQGGYTFEIRDQGGVALARLTYQPDVSRPYQSVIVEELLRRTGP